MGVMAEIGQMRWKSENTFPLVGIAPEGLVLWPGDLHSTKFLWWEKALAVGTSFSIINQHNVRHQEMSSIQRNNLSCDAKVSVKANQKIRPVPGTYIGWLIQWPLATTLTGKGKEFSLKQG